MENTIISGQRSLSSSHLNNTWLTSTVRKSFINFRYKQRQFWIIIWVLIRNQRRRFHGTRSDIREQSRTRNATSSGIGNQIQRINLLQMWFQRVSRHIVRCCRHSILQGLPNLRYHRCRVSELRYSSQETKTRSVYSVLTAQNRRHQHENTGIVLQNCVITATEELRKRATRVQIFFGQALGYVISNFLMSVPRVDSLFSTGIISQLSVKS